MAIAMREGNDCDRPAGRRVVETRRRISRVEAERARGRRAREAPSLPCVLLQVSSSPVTNYFALSMLLRPYTPSIARF